MGINGILVDNVYHLSTAHKILQNTQHYDII
nr:MAG TPA: hypothetical protein [Caudoviricetes sp.]